MILQQFPSGPFETNAYVAGCPLTHQAAIIDPALNSADPILAFLTTHHLQPEKILITHSHWDHIGDAALLKRTLNIPVLIHLLDLPNLEKPGSDQLPLWFKVEETTADQLLQEGDIIEIGNIKFKVIHTPGHSPGGMCFYSEEQGILFSGDTLFKGSIGNLSFPTANAEEMWKSLAKLSTLPPETIVYPGHGPSTTIGKEGWLKNAKQIFG